jgi:hypothetical protein
MSAAGVVNSAACSRVIGIAAAQPMQPRLFCDDWEHQPVANYSAGPDSGAEPESTTGTKFDIAATDQIRPIATTTAIIHASICIPSTSG